MHRYVALIANSTDQDSFDRLARRLARRFNDWRCALDERRAKAWVTSSPQSPIGFTSDGPSGCLIGVALGNRRPAPWDGAADDGLLSRSWGAYVAIKIGRGPEVAIIRDPGGGIACWTSRLSDADIYFSNIDDVPEAERGGIDPIDWDYIQYFLNIGNAHGRQTGLKAVTELLPGRQVQYSGGAGIESSAWPIADIIASPFESPAAAETGLRVAAEEAVGGWARRYDRIALELSGGFDSTVVLGLIRERVPDAQVLGINYLIGHPEGDERAYAQAAAEHHGITLLVEPVSADGRRFDLDKARNWLRPTIGATLAGGDARNRVASKIGVHAAFSGIGGDHVFGQGVPPSVLAEAAEDGLSFPRLLKIAHDYAKMSADTFWNIGWAAIKDLWGPRRALRALIQRPNYYLSRDGIEGANFERFAHPDVIEVGERVSSAKLHQILSFHELNKHYGRYSPEFEPDHVSPLQSQLVLEASLRIPSYWMNPAGRRRGLARRAFRDLVPEKILRRRGKGSTTSHPLQIIANNVPFLRELMLDGLLVRRGLLDKEKLEIKLSPHDFATKANLPGLFKCIVTELWVQSYTSYFTRIVEDKRFNYLVNYID